MFLGPRITTVFASRWKALAWSGGVLLTAYCSVPSDDDDTAGNGRTSPAVAIIGGMLGASTPAQAASHVSPWAITSPAPPPPRH